MIYYLGSLLFHNVKQFVLRILFFERNPASSLMKVSVVILSIRLLLLIINIIYEHSFIFLFIYCKYAIQPFKLQVFLNKLQYLSICKMSQTFTASNMKWSFRILVQNQDEQKQKVNLNVHDHQMVQRLFTICQITETAMEDSKQYSTLSSLSWVLIHSLKTYRHWCYRYLNIQHCVSSVFMTWKDWHCIKLLLSIKATKKAAKDVNFVAIDKMDFD